jgi:hypothetical protein
MYAGNVVLDGRAAPCNSCSTRPTASFQGSRFKSSGSRRSGRWFLANIWRSGFPCRDRTGGAPRTTSNPKAILGRLREMHSYCDAIYPKLPQPTENS